MPDLRLLTRTPPRRRGWSRLGWLPAMALLAVLSCGENPSPFSPEAARTNAAAAADDRSSASATLESARAAQGSGLTEPLAKVGSPSPFEPALTIGLPLVDNLVDDLFDFSPDGVLQFLELPDLSLTRKTGKLIHAAEGGSVELNGFRVEIPAGALAEDTYITVTLPSTLAEALYVVADFGPSGTTFQKPVQVTLPLVGVNLNGVDPASLNVSYWDGSQWVSYGGRVTSDAISAATTHFSTYGARKGVDTPGGG